MLSCAIPTIWPTISRRNCGVMRCAAWRAEVEGTIGGKAEGGGRKAENICDIRTRNLILARPSALRPPPSAFLPALADTVRRYRIPPEHLYAVIDGVEMDLDSRRYETFEELQPYCERVASAVGLACIHVWGFRGPGAFEPARNAGIALQLTNVLRDLKEDAAAGRVYLPLNDLRDCGYSVDDLMAGVDDERFRRLMAIEVARPSSSTPVAVN